MTTRRILHVCSCEDTMPLDAKALGASDGEVRLARQLCRAQLETFTRSLAEGRPVTVACTQEAPLFAEAAEEAGFAQPLAFANVRETGGWSGEAKKAGPKMAALLAAAAVAAPPAALVALKSEGTVLIYGRDETAIGIGERLRDILDVTVMLSAPGEIAPPRVSRFPVVKGRAMAAKGHLGAFEVAVEEYAQPSPSSRDRLIFGAGRKGTSRCDLIIDVSGGAPLFAAPDLRQGYLRADPADRAAVERVIFEASQLVGEFDKPRFIRFNASICAHSRSHRTGCTRCLELCPAGAITPNGDSVAISAEICMGCGACASVCPTGAAAYDYPPAATVMERVRALLLTYAEAGGKTPVLLVHDAEHGAGLIDALARFGEGLPAHVLPLEVNEVTQIGLECLAASFAHGAAAVRILLRARPKHDIGGLMRNIDYANALAFGLGLGEALAATIETDDPDALAAALNGVSLAQPLVRPAKFMPLGTGRQLLRLTLRELHAAAPIRPERIPLPPKAPIGGIVVDVEGCTLCHSCVSACPTGALMDNPDKPMLRFSEELCVQCGLCQATCPEKVIRLEPRIDFAAWEAPPKVMKEEEPFHCIQCGKPFGTKSTIERIAARLEGKHWMFAGENATRASILKMCDTCRIEAVVNETLDPHGAPPRPSPRTTEDYLREREKTGGKDPLA